MKSKLVLVAKGFLVIVALFVGFLGLSWAFAIDGSLEKFEITINTIAGLNTVKSIMGTGLIGTSAFAGLFVANPKKWYEPFMILISILLVVRITSLIMDGFHIRMAIYAVLELLIIVASMFVRRSV